MSAGPPSVEGSDPGALPPPGTASRVRVAVAGPVLCITMDSGLEPCQGAAAELPVHLGDVSEVARRDLQASASGPPCQSPLQAGLALRLGQAGVRATAYPPPGHCFLSQQRRGDTGQVLGAAHGTRCLFTREVPPALQRLLLSKVLQVYSR